MADGDNLDGSRGFSVPERIKRFVASLSLLQQLLVALTAVILAAGGLWAAVGQFGTDGERPSTLTPSGPLRQSPPGGGGSGSPSPPTGAPTSPRSEPRSITINLVDLEPVAGSNVDDELVHISGERYLNSLASKAYDCDRPVCEGYLLYDLGRNYTRLEMVAGLSDRSVQQDAEVALEVLGDGISLEEQPLVFGEPAVLDIDVTGILRLELRWVYFNLPPDEIRPTRSAQVVLGAPLLEAEPGYDPEG